MYEIADFLYKITMAQHLLLLAGVCPDVSHKADYSPDNKRYIQVFHKREFKVKLDLPPEGRAKIKRHGLLHTSPCIQTSGAIPG